MINAVISDLTVVNNVTVSKEGNVYTVSYESFSFGGNYHWVAIRYYGENNQLIELPGSQGYKDNNQMEFTLSENANLNIVFENDISHLYGWNINSII